MILISLNHKGPASELPSPEKWTQCRCICLPSQAISSPVSKPFQVRELRAQHHAPCPPEKRRRHNLINKSTKTSQAPGLGEAHHLTLLAPCCHSIWIIWDVYLHVFFFGRLLALQNLASIYFGFCSQFKLHCPTSILEIRTKYDRISLAISLAHLFASQQIMCTEQRTEDGCTFCLCVSHPSHLDVQATPRPSLENQLLQLQLLVLCCPHLVEICRASECIHGFLVV